MLIINMLQEELQRMPPVKYIFRTVHLATQEFILWTQLIRHQTFLHYLEEHWIPPMVE